MYIHVCEHAHIQMYMYHSHMHNCHLNTIPPNPHTCKAHECTTCTCVIHSYQLLHIGFALHPSAVLATSCAVARAGAILGKVPLHQHIAAMCCAPPQSFALPLPVVGALGSGLVGWGKLRFSEFCLVPSPGVTFLEQVTNLTAVYRQIGEVLANKAGVSDMFCTGFVYEEGLHVFPQYTCMQGQCGIIYY